MSFSFSRLSKLAVLATCLMLAQTVYCSGQGGNQGGGNNNGLQNNFLTNFVGGVNINASGVVESQAVNFAEPIRKSVAAALAHTGNAKLQDGVQLRKVSLRGIHDELQNALRENRAISNDAYFLGGLQRIEYVFVDPQNHDIILAGPAEGWTVDQQGNVVGKTTGCPTLRLDDLIVALRSAENARQGQGISCSINPTAEGAKRLSQMQNVIGEFNPDKAAIVEQLGGPQMITLTGIPAESRFSQVLVAADYKMKRLSMGFEAAPIQGMPSFLALCEAKGRARGNSSPRFWMECNYQPLEHSEDGLAWHLKGSGVKTLTEEGFITADGSRQSSAKPNALAEKWANNMTEHFEELAKKEPIFCELRNLMDMSVVGALIAKEDLLSKAGLEIPMIADADQYQLPTYNSPQTVPTQCSFVKLTGAWLVTASGGVQVDSWSVVENRITAKDLAGLRFSALHAMTPNQWWWN